MVEQPSASQASTSPSRPQTPAVLPAAGPRPFRGLVLSDLTDDLLWTKLLSVPGLALRPDRLFVSLFVMLIVGLLGWVVLRPTDTNSATWAYSTTAMGTSLSDIEPSKVAQMGWQALSEGAWPFRADGGSIGVRLPDAVRIRDGVRMLAWETPMSAFAHRPIATVLAGLAAIFVFFVGWGAVARSTALEFAQSVQLSWPESVAFSLKRWSSVVFGGILPLLIVGAMGLALGVAGWLLLHWPYVNVAGALVYGIFMLVGLGAVLLLGSFLLGGVMLVPTVVCECVDSLEAMQRVTAYVYARPMRLVLYTLFVILELVVVLWFFGLVADGVVGFTQWAAGAFLSVPLGGGTETGGVKTAGAILEFWNNVPRYIVGAIGLSFVFTASSVLYLLVRRLCDGQEVGDLWMPGMIPGTLSPEQAGAIQNAAMAEGPLSDDE
ncbi:MAG: hypothetical protein SFY96_00525 [Planctomycetota bacterium]|nr:hypothetical protein [Planctomycetota bacterium]